MTFHCLKCHYTTGIKNNFNKHLMTAKHEKMQEVAKVAKSIKSYFCEECNFNTSNKTNFKKHELTAKHIKRQDLSNLAKHKLQVAIEYICVDCNYKTIRKNDYNKHMLSQKHIIQSRKDSNKEINASLIMEIIKDNNELKQMLVVQQNENQNLMNKMIEITQTKQIIPSVANTVNNNNSNNTQFNLNIFLNETCKDAINFSQFIDNIQVSYDDLENNARNGFVNGISKLIVEKLKQLELINRPIHCTDVKRETIYVKENDQWEKDSSKNVIQKGIQDLTIKNMCKLTEWREENPEYDDIESDLSELSIAIQQNSMAGTKREDFYPKIIKNIAKETIIEKILV